MFISLNPSLLAGGKVGWPEIARLAARLGYPGVDVSLGPAMKEGVNGTKALFEHLRLKPGVIGFPVDFRKDDETFKNGLERLPAAAEFAAGHRLPAHGHLDRFLERPAEGGAAGDLPEALPRGGGDPGALRTSGWGWSSSGPLHLRKQNPHEFIWRMPEMVEFAAECGPNVGLLLDSWHWHHAGATTADILAAGKARIVHVHVNDAQDQCRPSRCATTTA